MIQDFPKICAITGAASGIGKSLMFSFANEGYRLIGIDKDIEQEFDMRKLLPLGQYY